MTNPATHLVYLPAAGAGNVTWGKPDLQMHWGANVSCHLWPSETQVWYNLDIRQQIMAYIDGLATSQGTDETSTSASAPERIILVGFSKSGLGALNLAPMLKDRLAGVVIFDTPTSMALRAGWGIEPFYPDDEHWQADLPANRIKTYASVFGEDCPLVLITGSAFHEQMSTFSDNLNQAGVTHQYIHRPAMKHNWQTGWLELAQAALALPS